MKHLIIFKDDDKLNRNIVELIDSTIDKFWKRYEKLNFSVNFYNDSTPLSQLKQEWKEELEKGNDFYIVLHQNKQKGEYSNYLEDFKNVIIRSHHDVVYEDLIPIILSGECTPENIKGYFPDEKQEENFTKIFDKYPNDVTEEIKALNDYLKDKK